MPPAFGPLAVDRLKLTAPPLWLAVVLPVGFFSAAAIILWFFGPNSPLWISNAFVVTTLLRSRRSTWPLLLGLGAVADYLANFVMVKGMTFIGLGIVACDSPEILLVALLSGFTEATSLDESIWPMARLAAVCLLVPMASAAGGATLLAFAYGVPFGEGWKNWYLANACGYLTVTPLLLSWTDSKLRTATSRQAALQTLALSGLVALAGYIDFHHTVPGLFLAFSCFC